MISEMGVRTKLRSSSADEPLETHSAIGSLAWHAKPKSRGSVETQTPSPTLNGRLVSSCEPYPSLKVASKPVGVPALRLSNISVGLSFLTETLKSKDERGTAASPFWRRSPAATGVSNARTFSALLRISQVELGSRKAGFNRVDLSTLFETIFETYVAVAEDAGHELIAQIAPSLEISGDRELLMQLGANLVENAIRHTPAGSRIKIDLHREADGAAAVFSDRGPGIPECEYGKAFRRFYRLESSSDDAGERARPCARRRGR